MILKHILYRLYSFILFPFLLPTKNYTNLQLDNLERNTIQLQINRENMIYCITWFIWDIRDRVIIQNIEPTWKIKKEAFILEAINALSIVHVFLVLSSSRILYLALLVLFWFVWYQLEASTYFVGVLLLDARVTVFFFLLLDLDIRTYHFIALATMFLASKKK